MAKKETTKPAAEAKKAETSKAKKAKAPMQTVSIADAKAVEFREPGTVMEYNGTRYHQGNITLEIAKSMVKANPVLGSKFQFK